MINNIYKEGAKRLPPYPNIEISNNRICQCKELTITSKDIESALIHFTYKGENKLRDEEVEKTKLPPMTYVLYSYIFKYNMIPSPDTFIKEYLNQSYFNPVSLVQVEMNYGNTVKVLDREGIEYHVLRAYPSLIRDFHFYLLAYESKKFRTVYYSFKEDYYNGIDIFIQFHFNWYQIALLQKSKNSLYYKDKKKNRHNGTNANVIYVELDKYESKKCGDFYLYTPNHISIVYNTIIQMNEKL